MMAGIAGHVQRKSDSMEVGRDGILRTEPRLLHITRWVIGDPCFLAIY